MHQNYLKIIEILFWIFIIIIFYTYIIYPIILFILNKFKKLFTKNKNKIKYSPYIPEVTIVILAYNEEKFIDKKVKNCLELIYPTDKLKILWVTDGSNDNTNNLLINKYKQRVLYEPERKGKVNAMNRSINYIDSPIIVFTDANTELNKTAIIKIVEQYNNDSTTGCVAGEKRILVEEIETASAAGEGIYWKYESLIKKFESELGSTIAAAGELFSIKKDLYTNIPDDTILDDFVLSLNVIKKGYKIKYTPDAYSYEKGSETIVDEFKRKSRIAAGSFQTLFRMPELLNFFKYGFISIEYISHKVLRWTLVPLSFPIILICNIFIVVFFYKPIFYYLLFLQIVFYILCIIGFLFKNKKIKFKLLFVPFYILMMNYAMYIGFYKFIKKKQTVLWEKVNRKEL